MEHNLSLAKAAGATALLVVDLPLEYSTEYFSACNAVGLAPVALVAPTTPMPRAKLIDQHCDSFIYYVCRNGITGVKASLPDNFVNKVQEIRAICDNKVVCGFGIGTRELAAQVLQHADGFVVGSAFVAAISAGASVEELQQLAQQIDPREYV